MRYKNILIGLLVVIVLGAAILWISEENRQTQASENALEASYQNSFFNLIENFENLDVLLGKVLVSNSDEQTIITLVTVWSMAEVAKTNLGNLPLGSVNMMRSNQYLAQLGDFSYSLAEKLASNREINETEWQQVKLLHQENRKIHNELKDLLSMMQEKQITLGRLASLSEDIKLTSESQDFLDKFGKLDERLQNEVPTLTYDGPFSDHVVNRKPRGLTGAMINKKEAEDIALKFAKSMNLGTKFIAKTTSQDQGRISSFSVSLHPEENGQPSFVFGISKKGGHVVFMIDVRERTEAQNISVEKATQEARRFVQKLELGEFTATGHLIEGNELLVNFALLEDDVVIYPDMIQVIVSLGTGKVVAYDSSKYLLSHTERKLPQPKITETEARTKVNKNLEIEQIRLALIPLGNLEEQLTYEIKGKIDEDTYYVYINSETGIQEKILLIVETPQGSKSI